MRNLLKVATVYGWTLVVWQLIGFVVLAVSLWLLWRLYVDLRVFAQMMGL